MRTSKIHLTNFISILVPKRLRHLVFMQFPLLTNNCWNEQNQETYPTGPLLLILFLKTSIFWCKNVPCTRYETLLLTEKNLRSYSGFQKGLIHQLHCDFSDYEKNTLAWIFKWLVAWKRSLPRPKFFFANLSPSSTLSYTITKKPKRVNLRRKSHWGYWSCDHVIFRFHIDKGPL